MTIVRNPDDTKHAPLAMTMGFFDGVHLGHRALIDSILMKCDEIGCKSAVYTFWPHPRLVLGKEPEKLRLLTTTDEKAWIITRYGVDFMIVNDFTPDFLKIEPEEYIARLVNRFNVKHITIGANHRFGKNGRGDAALIERLAPKFGYSQCVVDELKAGPVEISSTKIRKALLDGQLERANAMLGYPYIITGEVQWGRQIGRQLGFPTANIKPVEPLKLIPSQGVYAALVKIKDQTKTGMVHIGPRPTVDPLGASTIEVNIIDFDQQIYSSTIAIALVKRMRDVQRFANLDALRHQIKMDKILVDKVLNDKDLFMHREFFSTLQTINS